MLLILLQKCLHYFLIHLLYLQKDYNSAARLGKGPLNSTLNYLLFIRYHHAELRRNFKNA